MEVDFAFVVLMAAAVKSITVWYVTPCSVVEILP
jgi:hypothetical protein